MKDSFKSVVYLIFGLILGIALDRIVKNYPLLKFDGEINALSLLNFILTLAVILFLSKLIEDKKSIKNFIIDEIKLLLADLENIRAFLSELYQNGKVTNSDRDKLRALFHNTELRVSSVSDQMESAFPKKSKAIIEDLFKVYNVFDKEITGGELFGSNYKKIDHRFYKECTTGHNKIRTHLKTTIQKVFKF